MKIDVNLRDTTGCFIPLPHIESEILDVLKVASTNIRTWKKNDEKITVLD
jgi:hypothetical protein